jgi:RNA polymerase sigma-70 factor (ECF subfamily)
MDYTGSRRSTSRRQVDPDRLRNFVATEYPRVVGIVTLVCGDGAHAEDSVQEALARACEQEARGVHIENLAAWITTVASNDTRSRYRRRQRELRALHRLGPRLDPPGEPGAVAEVVAVRRAIATLPLRQRQAVALRYFLGLDLAEIAAELGVAEGTVKALLFQGRRRLAELLGEPAEQLRTTDVAPPPPRTLPRMGEVT